MKIIYNIKSKRKYTTPTIKLIEVEADGALLQGSPGNATGDDVKPGEPIINDYGDIPEY